MRSGRSPRHRRSSPSAELSLTSPASRESSWLAAHFAPYNPRMSCLFCRIIAGEIPASKVYEDDRLIAFNDINPQAPMHVLIVPREHIPTANDLTPAHDSLVGEMIRRAAALAAERGYAQDGFRTVFN